MKQNTYFSFINPKGEIYAGGGRWSKNLKDIKMFVSQKTATKNLICKTYQEYLEAELIKVSIAITESRQVETAEGYCEYEGNWYYEQAKKKAGI